MSVLDELVAGALEDKCDRERVTSLEELKARAASAPAPLDAKRWLRRHDGIPVIAEIKRASPSKGHLIDIEDPAALGRQYEQGGASAISVLTEGRRFLGSLDDVDAVRAAVHIPVLRKDFITTDYQIWEARAHGADIVLLIVGMFLEGGAALIILAPLMVPIVKAAGIDLVHFGIVCNVNIMIGGLTPPFGSMMFTCVSITGCKMQEFIKECVPFIIALLIALLLLTYIPGITMLIPNLIY